MINRHYQNPIIRGTHPEPSLCRVGEDYNLCTSTFACFPAAPIFHSRDLVHWQPVGHALTRPEQLPLDGVAIPRGMYAPSLRDEFDAPSLRLDWLTLRKPPPGTWSLTELPGHLRLHGNAATLDDGGTFTGMILGLYATGNGAPCNAPADFDCSEYTTEGNA
jgi:beta-xylosidase